MVAGATGLVGIVLRYGAFYGPGTSVAIGGDIVEMLRGRKFPLIGNGAGVWSFIHIDDAAEATRVAIQQGPAGIYNIVDDEPVTKRENAAALAAAAGARTWIPGPGGLAKLLGDRTTSLTRSLRVSNARFREATDWSPRFPSVREGYRDMAERMPR